MKYHVFLDLFGSGSGTLRVSKSQTCPALSLLSWVFISDFRVLGNPVAHVRYGYENVKYTVCLAPMDFSDEVFTRAHFQKIAQISSLCDFHYISERIPSLMHFWLLMT